MPPLPTPDTICAVTVTYHPDAGLIDRVGKIAEQVGRTVIVDNGSPHACVEQLKGIADQLHVDLILNGENRGLACALNTGALWAMEQGFRWILALDQDTIPLPDLVSSVVQIVRECPFSEGLAVVGSNYLQKENGKLALDLRTDGNALFAETRTALTSGSLFALDVFKIVGGFRDDFFIDCVDHEYCLRARAHGFRIVVSSRALMEHGIGHLREHRLLWRTVGTANHPPRRQYFLARNSFILAREYLAKEPDWMLGYLWAWTKSIVRVCLFEEERMQKMKNTLHGCVDGIVSRRNGEMAASQGQRCRILSREDGIVFGTRFSEQKARRHAGAESLRQ